MKNGTYQPRKIHFLCQTIGMAQRGTLQRPAPFVHNRPQSPMRSRGRNGRFQKARAGGGMGQVSVLGQPVDLDDLVRIGAGCKANMDDPSSFCATLPGLAELYPSLRHWCDRSDPTS